jgi:hypothetical protein
MYFSLLYILGMTFSIKNNDSKGRRFYMLTLLPAMVLSTLFFAFSMFWKHYVTSDSVIYNFAGDWMCFAAISLFILAYSIGFAA